MLQENPFYWGKANYTRNVDPLKHYVDDGAFFLHKLTGDSLETTRAYVEQVVATQTKDPRVLMLERNEQTGDRERKITTLATFLREAIERDDLVSPNLCVFIQPSVKESYQRIFTKRNIDKRNDFKSKAKAYKMAKDDRQFGIYNKYQNNRKLSNNALSGTYCIGSTPLGNPTSHTTLTSTCRITSGYGNANNEKLIAGNRHYWSMDIVLNNITAIVNHTDYPLLEQVMSSYNLHYPTVAETMACIRRGAFKYFRTEWQYDEIEHYLTKLTPLELAAFVYTGDLYHLKMYNPDFMRKLFTQFITTDELIDGELALRYIAEASAIHYTTAMDIHCKAVAGIVVKNIKDPNNELVRLVGSTIRNLELRTAFYSDFIKVFFASANVPASLAHFPSSVRHVVLASDTDSTIFTTQQWVMWYTNQEYTNPISDAVGALVNLFASETITHLLALMSANFGVKGDDLDIIAMKNEYKFDVFGVTDVSKHYMALKTIQEGNVFSEYEKEIKGVHMRSSNAPPTINKHSERMLLDIMETIQRGDKVKPLEVLKTVADSERRVAESFTRGDPSFTRKGKVKVWDSYGLPPDRSPYRHYTFWQAVFAEKYGDATPPPYTATTVKTENLNTPSKIQAFIDELECPIIKRNLQAYVDKHKPASLNTFFIPNNIVNTKGIPPEILQAIDYRGIVRDVHKTHYLVLGALGLYVTNRKESRLVSDYY